MMPKRKSPIHPMHTKKLKPHVEAVGHDSEPLKGVLGDN